MSDDTHPLSPPGPEAPEQDPYIGTVIDGRYAVDSILGEGGMGVVYAGRHQVIDKRVAIKVLRSAMAQNREVTDRFLQEAKAASTIGNPHIIDVSDFGSLPDGSTYLVMEYVGGKTLTEVTREMRPFPLRRTLSIAKQIATGLGAAHEAGIVHRDLKPDNVMIVNRSTGAAGASGAGRDFVKILDFGIAKVVGDVTAKTRAGAIFGTPQYMSPEQASGIAVDRRTDVYALGVMLYQMACGRLPLDADNFMALLNKHVNVVPVPLLQLVPAPAVPASFDALVQRCLAKKPDDRYASMADLLEALEGVEHEDTSAPASALSRRAGVIDPRAAPTDASASGPDLLVPDLAPRSASPKSAKLTGEAAPRAAKPRAGIVPASDPDDDIFGIAGGPSLQIDLGGPASGHSSSMSSSRSSVSRPSASRVSSLDARGGPDELHSVAPRARVRGRGVLLTGVLLAGAIAAVVVQGPTVLKSFAVQGAARRGFALTVDHVEPRSGGLVLSGVSLAPEGMRGCTLKAAEAEVTLDWQGNVQKIVVPGYELVLRGNGSDVAERFSTWRKQGHAPTAFEATAGHVVWSDVLMPGVDLDAVDVTMAFGADGESALHLESSSMSAKVPRGQLGPWHAQLDSTNTETKVTVAFDRSKPDAPPNAILTARPDLGRLLSITIPRRKLDDIGLPTEPFHMPKGLEVDLAFEGQVLPTGQPVNAKTKLMLFKWPLAIATGGGTGTPAPVDMTFEGTISGNSTNPLRLEKGVLTVGKASAPVTGWVELAPDGIRAQVERTRAKGPALPTLVFDTRDWIAAAPAAVPTGGSGASAPAPTGSASTTAPASSASGH